MTGLHHKRKAVESSLVKRRAQSKRAAEVPARQIQGIRKPGLPRKRESSATRTPLSAAGDSTTVSYVLRNRQVVVPIAPATTRPNDTSSYKNDKEPELAPSRQTPVCAQMALEHYNTTNQGDEHELVKAVESNAFVFNGVWIHANFLAKPIGASSCDVPNYFFAELKSDYKGFCCLSCVKMDPGEPRKLGGCGVCPLQIMHPADGGYRNAQPFNKSSTSERCGYTF